jgi:hypothetical protein
MGQLFHKTGDQMNNWRWDNPRVFGDQVDHSNPQTTSFGKVQRAGGCIPWYSSDDRRAKIEPPSCQQYKPRTLLAVRPLNWDEIIDENDDDENCAAHRTPCAGWSRPGDDNVNDNGKGEEDTQGGGKGTRESEVNTGWEGERD